MMNKIILILALALVTSNFANAANDLSLKYCLQKAAEKNPMNSNSHYYSAISALQQLNLKAQYYPQLKLEGQATYQSDVFAFPLKIPGISLPEIDKFQYQASITLSQLIFDGGYVSSSLDANAIEEKLNQKSIELTTQKAVEFAAELFFAAAAIDDNIEINSQLLSTLESKLKEIRSLVENGVLLKTTATTIEIEILKTQQRIASLKSDKKSTLEILSSWIGDSLSGDERIILPAKSETERFNLNQYQIKRLEYDIFALRAEALNEKKNTIQAQIMPNASAFIKAGFSAPNPYNFFDNEFGPFYMVGIRLQWNIWDWFQNNRSREILNTNSLMIAAEEENFTRAFKNQLTKEENTILKYNDMLLIDNEIIRRQSEITENLYSRLIGGVATATDYINELNNAAVYSLNQKIHELQRISAVVNIMIKTGNFDYK